VGYLPGTWRDFGVTVASLAGALTGIAGLSFLLKAGGGLYWMIPAVLAGLVGGVINAWLFLIKVPGSSVPG
jgi:hypothetical protein